MNRRICIFCDNESVVRMLNDNTSGCRNCMVLIRMIVLEGLTWNARIFAKHVQTRFNGLADALSRFQMHRFYSLAAKQKKNFNEQPCVIPEALLPMEKI